VLAWAADTHVAVKCVGCKGMHLIEPGVQQAVSGPANFWCAPCMQSQSQQQQQQQPLVPEAEGSVSVTCICCGQSHTVQPCVQHTSSDNDASTWCQPSAWHPRTTNTSSSSSSSSSSSPTATTTTSSTAVWLGPAVPPCLTSPATPQAPAVSWRPHLCPSSSSSSSRVQA
jgi:hypothetical protein